MAFVTTKPGITAGLFKSFYMPMTGLCVIAFLLILFYNYIYGAKKTVQILTKSAICFIIYETIKHYFL